MALNNCSISSSSVNVTKGNNLTGVASQELIITPNAGYCVAAANFSQNTDLSTAPWNAQINAITLSDKNNDTGGAGTPYADNNVVKVLVDLKDSYTASDNATFTIDIDGDATDKKLRPYTFAGTWDQVVNGNVTASPITNASGNSYSGSGLPPDPPTVIINQTYTCASGYYFTAAPTFTNNGHTGYTATITETDWENGLPIKYKVEVEYSIGSSNVTGHNVDISANAVSAIPVTANLISSVLIDDDLGTGDFAGIPPTGAIRTLKIYGNAGASTRLWVKNDGATDADDRYYNFTTNEFTGTTETYSANITIPSNGIYEVDIHFPAQNVTPLEQYVVSVIGGTSPATKTVQGGTSNNDAFVLTIYQRQVVTVTTTASGTNLSAAYTNNVLTVPYGLNVDDFGNTTGGKSLEIAVTHSGGKVLHVRRDPVFSDDIAYNVNTNATIDYDTMSDFTNTKTSTNGGTYLEYMGLTATGTGTTTVTVKTSESGYAGQIGGTTVTVSPNLNLDNIINQAPVASSNPYNGTEDTTLNIDLSASVSKPETSDSLTYSIVSDNTGTNGALTLTDASAGTLTYVPALNNNTNTNFTWKVNDGYEDSNTATATINISAVNDPPTAITLGGQASGGTVSVAENAGVTVAALATTDVDPGTHTYSIVSGTGDTDNAKFTISGSNLRWAITPDYEIPVDSNTDNDYLVIVRSTDDGGQTIEGNWTVRVTNANEAPTNIALSATSINENNSINAVIGAFSTTDQDAGDSHTYTLVSGTGSTDNSSFNISGSNLRASAAFDYEVKSSYSIRVRSTDSGGLYFEKQFTITINDVAEAETCYRADICVDANADGVYEGPIGGVAYISPSKWCNGTTLTTEDISTWLAGKASSNKYIKYDTVASGCTSSGVGRAQLDGTTVSAIPTAYLHMKCTYTDCNLSGSECD